jgi:hypothetical protein
VDTIRTYLIPEEVDLIPEEVDLIDLHCHPKRKVIDKAYGTRSWTRNLVARPQSMHRLLTDPAVRPCRGGNS